MQDIKKIFNQEKNINYVKNELGTETWVQISGHRDLNGADAHFWCGLVDIKKLDKVFLNCGWDISLDYQSLPGFITGERGYNYTKNTLEEGFESFLYYREFYGTKPNYIEVSQEFILLNNLRHNSRDNTYEAMLEDGSYEKVIKYDEDNIYVKCRYLIRYAAAKQMAFLIFYDIRIEFAGKYSDFNLKHINTKYKDNNVFYSLASGESFSPNYIFSRLLGKKIFMPQPISKCRYWPYDKKEEFEKFIIGMDDSGEDILYTCNPDKLNNYFDINPEAPMYLTPVSFKRDVLNKYLDKSNLYEVGDGYLQCASVWRLSIDNHYQDEVKVYLGDLGRDLPESERKYWRNFNIVGDTRLSEVSVRRDFFNSPIMSNMPDHQFLYLYSLVNQKWRDKFGWPLFLSLDENDKYNLKNIHIPINESQQEFDHLVLSIVKVLIDSLNEKQLKSRKTKSGSKSISKLENWLREKNVDNYQKHIKFLRDLQELRSTGVGHRKGRNYDKIANKFDLNTKSKSKVYENILNQANSFLIFLLKSCLNFSI